MDRPYTWRVSNGIRVVDSYGAIQLLDCIRPNTPDCLSVWLLVDRRMGDSQQE